jgi:hypothetical protein
MRIILWDLIGEMESDCLFDVLWRISGSRAAKKGGQTPNSAEEE